MLLPFWAWRWLPPSPRPRVASKAPSSGASRAIWRGTARSALLPDASSAIMRPTSGTRRKPIGGPSLPRPGTITSSAAPVAGKTPPRSGCPAGSRCVDGLACGKELAFERLRRHRPAEEIALPLFASHADQEIGGRAVLDPFGAHRQAELPAQSHGRADDGRIAGIGEQFEHEGAVDLQSIERKFLQIAQARIAGAEIIEHDADAERPYSSEGVEHALLVQQQNILGHLEFEQRRRQARGLQYLRNRGCKVGRLELRGGEIDAATK